MATRNQDIFSASNFAIAKKEFNSKVLETFELRVKLWPLVDKQTRTGLKESETTQPGRAGDATYHEPGTDLNDGSARSTQAITRFFEDRATLWNTQRTDVEELVDHTNFRSMLPVDAGSALARKADTEAFKALAVGAATATSGDFDGGQTAEIAGTTVSTAIAKTSAGAELIEGALDDIIQGWSEDHVDVDGEDMFAFISPYLMNVVKKHRDYFNADYNGPEIANFANKKLGKLSRFWLIETNNLPTTDSSAATQPTFKGTVQYGQDNTLLAALCMKAGALSAFVSPQESWMEWDTNHQIWNIGAKFFKGITVERAHYCGRITVSGV